MRRDMGSKSKVFQPKVPDGPVCNITPNGKVYDEGEQHYFSNGFMGRGNLGTANVGERTRDTKDIPKANRSGESIEGSR